MYSDVNIKKIKRRYPFGKAGVEEKTILKWAPKD
jgi:hypothetical protein